MKKQNISFQIFSQYLKIGDNKYQIAKNLKIPTSLVCYHLKKIKALNIDYSTLPDFKEVGEDLLPVLQTHFDNIPYSQTEFFLSFLFYYLMNEFH